MDATPLYLSPTLRRIEASHADEPLMERAGTAAARWAVELAAGNGGPVLVLAGPGNNGGDAFVAARLLRERFFDVRLVFGSDPVRLPADAAAARRRFLDAGGAELDAIPDAPRWALTIDGLFGIGLARTPRPLRRLDRHRQPRCRARRLPAARPRLPFRPRRRPRPRLQSVHPCQPYPYLHRRQTRAADRGRRITAVNSASQRSPCSHPPRSTLTGASSLLPTLPGT